MKKMLLACLVLAATMQGVLAQNLSFGPTIGVGHSWMTGFENVKFKPSVNVGGTLVYSFVSHWGVGADLRASFLEGVRTKTENGNASSEYKMNATFLRVPFKAYYFFGEYGDRVRPKLYAGPSLGFLLGGKTKLENTSGSTTNTIEGDTKDVLKSFDFGFVAGAGLNYRLKKNTWLNVDLNYQNGLVDMSETPNSFNATRNIGVNVGVTFPLGTVVPDK